jgi:replicative DNA helicase
VPSEVSRVERALLGGVLHDAKRFWEAKNVLGDLPFLTPSYQQIWNSMARLAVRGDAIDVLTLTHDLGGGPVVAVLAGMCEQVASGAAVVEHARIVRDWSIRNQLGHVLAEGRELIRDRKLTADEVAGRVQELLLKSVHAGNQGSIVDAADVARAMILGERRPAPTTPTGFESLDVLLGGGLTDSNAVVVAGRPGMGKTAFAVQAAFQLADARGKPSLVFSLEMAEEELVSRLLSGLSRVPHYRIKASSFRDSDFPMLRQAAVRLEGQRIRICEAPAITLLQLQARARTEAVISGGLSSVVVDYLQIMGDPVAGAETREQAVSTNMRGLKALAKELKCPVLVVSQLNRGVEKRDDKRPFLGDLRDSGAIEQDADVVMFLYRPGYYENPRQSSGPCEVIIAKQRQGDLGTTELMFTGATTSFQERW